MGPLLFLVFTMEFITSEQKNETAVPDLEKILVEGRILTYEELDVLGPELVVRAKAEVSQNTGEIFGDIAASLRKKGGHAYRVQDLWLASQAIQHGFHFLTKNKKDFEGIPGLSLVLWKK